MQQGESGPGEDYAWRVFPEFWRRALVACSGGRFGDFRPSLLQVHATSRSLRRGCSPTRSLCALRASHLTNLLAGEGRRLFGRLRLGRRMGSNASRSSPLDFHPPYSAQYVLIIITPFAWTFSFKLNFCSLETHFFITLTIESHWLLLKKKTSFFHFVFAMFTNGVVVALLQTISFYTPDNPEGFYPRFV